MMWTVFSLVLVSSLFVLKSKSTPFFFPFLLHLHFLPQAWLNLFAVWAPLLGWVGLVSGHFVYVVGSTELHLCKDQYVC